MSNLDCFAANFREVPIFININSVITKKYEFARSEKEKKRKKKEASRAQKKKFGFPS